MTDVTAGRDQDGPRLPAADELDDYLGYGKHDPAGCDGGNSLNDHRVKTVITDTGPVEIDPAPGRRSALDRGELRPGPGSPG